MVAVVATAALAKLPSRKQLENSRSSRRFVWLAVSTGSKALVATSFCLLLLFSLFFLDMEFIYQRVQGTTAPSVPADGLLQQAIAQEPSPARVPVVTDSPALPESEELTEVIDKGSGVPETSNEESAVVDQEIVAMEGSTAVPETIKEESVVIDRDSGVPETSNEESAVVEVVDQESAALQEKVNQEIVAIEEGSAAAGPEEEVLVVEGEQVKKKSLRSLKGCAITQGRWVYDNVSYPLYRTKNCPFADPGFRCEDNGRPDKEFMSYHWQPHDCDLPRFNATDMLERLRGQRMVFVGDSLGRNNWESMLCMLAEGVPDKSRIYEINGHPITKHSGKLIYRFKDYDCTIEYYRDPFLVPQTRPPRDHPPGTRFVLRVDHVSWSADAWINADIIIFNAGHWWTENKIFKQGCRFEENGKVQNFTLQIGLEKALKTWATYLEKELDTKKTQVFWMSFPSVHFRGGTWNRGGHCHQEKRPLTEEEARNEWQTPWMNQIVQESLFPNIKKKLKVITYLDITTATNYRPDGHGALYTWDTKKYGLKPRNHQDCSHFCLPGVPDAWNELILGSLLAQGKHTWARPPNSQ